MVIATPGTGNIQPRVDGAKPIFAAAGYDAKEVGTDAAQAKEEPLLEQWYLGHKDVKAFYCVDSGDSIAAATIIGKYNLGGKVGGSGWDIGLPVLQQVQKEQPALHHRPAGVPARLHPDDPAVPLQHLGWIDEALQHRHWPRFCDQRQRGPLHEHLEPLRRQQQGPGRFEASCQRSAKSVAQAAVTTSDRPPVPPAPPVKMGRGVTPASVLRWAAQRREATVIAITILTIIYFRAAQLSSLFTVDNTIVTMQYVAPYHRDRRRRSPHAGARRDRPLRRPGVPDSTVVRLLVLERGRPRWFGHPPRLGPERCHRLAQRADHRLAPGAVLDRHAGYDVSSLRPGAGRVQLHPGADDLDERHPAGFARPDPTMSRLPSPGVMPARAELGPPFSLLVLQQYPRHRQLGHHPLGPAGHWR